MVGILIVSHSKKVADGIVELAEQISGGNKHILSAGGMEDGSIGTDALRIKQGIEEADDGDGVVILADLGSGILSARTAIDLLESDIKVQIADAPILEGAISAAAQASVGDSFEAVIEAAEEAGKMSKLT